ncbi:MAG: Na+/H+ antiporter subunit E [Elusimicrobiota bacterium]
MIGKIIFYIASYIIWLFLTWPFNPLNLQDIITGLVVALGAVLIFGRNIGQTTTLDENNKRFNIKIVGWALVYIPVLMYYMIIANLDVLYRIIKTDRPINPGIVKINTELKSPLSRAILCNSITLTPGTLTVDIKEDIIYVHWINITASSQREATEVIAGRFEKILKKVFE